MTEAQKDIENLQNLLVEVVTGRVERWKDGYKIHQDLRKVQS